MAGDRHLTPKQAGVLASFARQEATDLGFSVCRITPTGEFSEHWANHLNEAIDEHRHGSMAWLAETRDRRGHPQAMWQGARTAIMVALNYGPTDDPMATIAEKDLATISVYARNRDYHQIIKGRLKTLAGRFLARARQFDVDGDIKVFVDTAPLMEKPLAMQAGVGWMGKHTNLVSTDHGSWLFLGAVLTDLELPADEAEPDHCGSCRACLDSCPTNAFPAPYKLDARRCISYLTIEHKGPIDRDLRPAMGNRIFGCDDCLAACPWNKFAKSAQEIKLQARPELTGRPLQELAALDETAFRALFAGSPVKRIGHAQFIRNVLIGLGNSGRVEVIPAVRPHLDNTNPFVRGAAVWALAQLAEPAQFRAERTARMAAEVDEDVRQEWELGA
jgi:epoxyqueuosine reductase